MRRKAILGVSLLALFIVWDEPTPTPNVIISPTTPAGSKLTEKTDHFGLLRTTEEMLGLPPLAKAARAASWRTANGSWRSVSGRCSRRGSPSSTRSRRPMSCSSRCTAVHWKAARCRRYST